MNLIMALTIALVGGEIHTMDGAAMAQGTVLIKNGQILAVGQDLVIPADADVVQLDGAIVTPGLIDAWTQLGLVEISGVDASNDTRSGLGDFLRPFGDFGACSRSFPDRIPADGFDAWSCRSAFGTLRGRVR